MPRQLLVRSPKGGGTSTALPHGTSIFDARLKLPREQDVETREGVRIVKLGAALIVVGPGEYTARPAQMRAALAMVRDASDVLSGLLAALSGCETKSGLGVEE